MIDGECLVAAGVGGFRIGAVIELVDGDSRSVGVDDPVVGDSGFGVDVAFAAAVEVGGAGREDFDYQQRRYG